MTLNELVAQLGEDKVFIEKVCTAETVEQIKALFLEKSVEVDDEAANAFLERVKAGVSDELAEEDLENVSGGFICTASMIATAAVLGAIMGISLAAALLKLYKNLKYGR